ncbi:uncharacterized protein LOC136089883 [Hydra vulgaris]|uniref:Uncharacterized protein LOC136089883 n=1 Tax=Hydra vulgaris TaxID=6087 RepID=A0ABM4DCC2_HYDVU
MYGIRLEVDISLENGNVNRQVNRRRNERDRLRRDKINNQQNTREMLLGKQQRIRIQMKRAWLGELKINVAEMREVGLGKIKIKINEMLEMPSPFPQDLKDLFKRNSADGNANLNFFKYFRNYDACFFFALLKANLVQPMNHGPPCFRTCGQVFHHIGNLRPKQDVLPTYCQLYIYDPLAAINFRIQQCGNDHFFNDLMFRLQTIISDENPFALAFKKMAEVEDEEIHRAALEGRSVVSVVKMSLLEGQDRRRHNLPSHNEVAVVFGGEDGAQPASREVLIYPRDHPLKNISSMSANLDPMIYSLFFPKGDAGWHNQLIYSPERATLQYAVDAYVKIESQRFAFIRNNQNKIRSEQYDVFHEHVNNLGNDHNVRPGRAEILQLTHAGSLRALKENFEDAMAIIKKYGKPDLFITFTCNPKWREITENLYPGQTANDRSDSVTRLETAHDINNFTSAEIPDPIVNCDPYDVVKTCIIHGPCGSNVDNRWVIHYNPYLSEKYQAHINVEACICRYVSAPEALWRTFEYSISHMSHTIKRHKVHLPENLLVYFREGAVQMALDRAAQRDTHLTAWFKLNTKNESAHCYLYIDIPYHFIFDDKHCKWKVRQRSGNKMIVRMYKVYPTGEIFFIRLLLLQAKGATSWGDVRSVKGIVLETFREACVLKGLLQDDTEWQNTVS